MDLLDLIYRNQNYYDTLLRDELAGGEPHPMIDKLKDSRAQTNLAGLFIGILVAAVIGIAVFIPVVNDVIASSNVTGTTKTILDLLPMFGGLLLLIGLASPLMRRY